MLPGGSRFDESRTLVFMRVPKTSGTSITFGLIEALAPAVVISGFDHSLFSFSDDYSSLDEAIRCRIYSSPESMPKHADLVAGHLAFSTLTKAYPTAQRITILREPFSRLLSHWLYWRQLADSDLAPLGELGGFRSTRARAPRKLSEHTIVSLPYGHIP
jgi:Sulfotransferase family